MARERAGMIFTASVSFSFAYAFIGLWSLIEEIMAFIGFILGSTRLAGKVFFFFQKSSQCAALDDQARSLILEMRMKGLIGDIFEIEPERLFF